MTTSNNNNNNNNSSNNNSRKSGSPMKILVVIDEPVKARTLPTKTILIPRPISLNSMSCLLSVRQILSSTHKLICCMTILSSGTQPHYVTSNSGVSMSRTKQTKCSP